MAKRKAVKKATAVSMETILHISANSPLLEVMESPHSEEELGIVTVLDVVGQFHRKKIPKFLLFV